MKMLFMVLFSLLIAVGSSAETLVKTKDAEFELNRASPGAMAKHKLGTRVTKGVPLVAKATYDFAVLGGANGTYNLRGDDGKAVVIPDNAVIVECIIDVLTPGTTSGAATIALNVNSAGDLKTATGAASYTGLVACTPVGTAATAIKLTADRTLTATIASQPVTAGKFVVLIRYILSD